VKLTRDSQVGVILSGGNVDPESFSRLLAEPALTDR
jgi:threonine dehydratase